MRAQGRPLRLLLSLPEPDARVAALVVALLPEGQDIVHRYEPHGVSWVRLDDHRRVVVHTWPEHALTTIDLFGPGLEHAEEVLAAHGWTVARRQAADGLTPR